MLFFKPKLHVSLNLNLSKSTGPLRFSLTVLYCSTSTSITIVSLENMYNKPIYIKKRNIKFMNVQSVMWSLQFFTWLSSESGSSLKTWLWLLDKSLISVIILTITICVTWLGLCGTLHLLSFVHVLLILIQLQIDTNDPYY